MALQLFKVRIFIAATRILPLQWIAMLLRPKAAYISNNLATPIHLVIITTPLCLPQMYNLEFQHRETDWACPGLVEPRHRPYSWLLRRSTPKWPCHNIMDQSPTWWLAHLAIVLLLFFFF